MCRILVVYEPDARGRVPDTVSAVAAAAGTAGAEVRVHTLDEVGRREIDRADAIAFGIDGRGALLPVELKRWLDGLGFGSWHHLRDKPGCVFPIRVDGAEPGAACRTVARIFRSRGMNAVTPVELSGPDVSSGASGARIGHVFGRWCMRAGPAGPRSRREAG